LPGPVASPALDAAAGGQYTRVKTTSLNSYGIVPEGQDRHANPGRLRGRKGWNAREANRKNQRQGQ